MNNTNTQPPSFLASLINNASQPETLRILQTLVVTYWNDSKICPSDRDKLNEMIAAKQDRIQANMKTPPTYTIDHHLAMVSRWRSRRGWQVPNTPPPASA